MQLILLKDIKGIGKKGQVVQVSDGHGRNFLLPQGIACVATSQAVAEAQRAQKAQKGKVKKDRKRWNQIAVALEGRTIALVESANEQNHLYAAVTARRICDILKSEFPELEEKMVGFEVMKKIGGAEATLTLPGGMITKIAIVISAK